MSSAAQLQVVLLALLGSQGAPITTAELAKVVSAPASEVSSALQAAEAAGSVRHDARTDGWTVVKKGGAL